MSEFSWAAMVYEADKDFNETPCVYMFPNGRKFYDSGPKSGVYATNFLLDADGNHIVDANGDWIRTRV